jgi:dolichyl-phosphate-mannose-protein mannosyltransferase
MAARWQASWSRAPILLAVLLVLASGLSAISITQGINPNDEGIVLQAAARIAHGQLPYRDFYANYGPGEYYLVALLNGVFGPSLLTWRILSVILDGLVATLAYVLARRLAGPRLALLAWLAVAGAMAFPQVPNPNTPMLALAFGALLLVRRSPAGAGALAGLALAFRLDAGLAVIAGVVIAAFAEGGGRMALRAGVSAVVLAVVLVAPFVIAAPADFWHQTLGFGLTKQSLQRLPLPGLDPGSLKPSNLLHHYYPYVLLAGSLLWAIQAVRARAPLQRFALAPLALAGVLYLLARADDFHLIPLAAVLPILLAVTVGERRRPGRLGLAGVSVVLFLVAAEGLDQKRLQLVNAPPSAAISVDAGDGVQAPVADARALPSLVRYVRARVPPGAPVFVANPRYDLVNAGDPLLYVLLDRPNPTRYDVMQPGVVTSAGVQREMVSELIRSRPRIVVRWLSPLADQVQPDGAGRSSGVHLLDRYLTAHYAPVRRFGDYLVLQASR